MTTESKTRQGRPSRTAAGPGASSGAGVLLGAAAAGLAVVLAIVALAGLVDGADAATAAAVGGGAALLVFAFGTTVVHVVSGILPAASLLVALLTYTLQLVVLALVVLGVAGTPLAEEQAARAWFAGALIATTAGWLAAQVWRATHLRIPAYEAGAR